MDALFQVMWKSGDLTWLPYDRVEHLSQLEEYFELIGIPNITELRRTGAPAPNNRTFLGSMSLPDSQNNMEHSHIYEWNLNEYELSTAVMSTHRLPDPPTAPTPSASPNPHDDSISPYHDDGHNDGDHMDESVDYAGVSLTDSPDHETGLTGAGTKVSLADRITAAPEPTTTSVAPPSGHLTVPANYHLDVSMIPDIHFNRSTSKWEIIDSEANYVYELNNNQIRDLLLLSYGLGGDWSHIVPDAMYHRVTTIINARIPQDSPYQFAVIGDNGRVVRREKPMRFEHFWTKKELQALGPKFNSRNLQELTLERFPPPNPNHQRRSHSSPNFTPRQFRPPFPSTIPTSASGSGDAWTRALATAEGQDMMIHGILGLARRSMMHDRSRNGEGGEGFGRKRFRPYGTGNRGGRMKRGVEVMTTRK
ncbi:hypothetical protein AAF712_012628 [Marasmius tenuissimus]|uniref:Uncharacterized protein n=1 Tax=Marasmius tenuissimus TaxID=585030 RepID=A0ABR2ZFX7_9AGAR